MLCLPDHYGFSARVAFRSETQYAGNGYSRLRNPAAPGIPGFAIHGNPAQRAKGPLDLWLFPPRPFPSAVTWLRDATQAPRG